MIKDFFVFEWKDTEDTFDEKKNFLPVMTPKIMFGKDGIISTPDSKVKVVVLPTDEELMIASDTMALVK